MTSVKGWHTGREWLMTLSLTTDSGYVFFIILYIKKNYLDLEKILSSG